MTTDPTTTTPNARYLIWSHHYQMWWGPDGCGYYRDITNAGRYTLDATEY